jgi:ABC-2 type transport system permease protein
MTAVATTPVSTAAGGNSPLAGTGQMIRLALRRDRVMIPLWILAAVGTVAATVSAFKDLYPDVPGRLAFSASIENSPTLRALTGVIYDGSTIGGLTAWRVSTIQSGGLLDSQIRIAYGQRS